jgi:hypothetical protein
MRIRWTTRLTVIIGLLSIAAGVAARPAHAAVHAQPARTVAAAAYAAAGGPPGGW